MSAITFDTELSPAQAVQDAAASTATLNPPAEAPGLVLRMLDALGRAFSVELPNGEIIYVTPF